MYLRRTALHTENGTTFFDEPTVADAILDRLLGRSMQVKKKGILRARPGRKDAGENLTVNRLYPSLNEVSMVRRVLALALLLSLLACGGGGGSGVTTDAEGTTSPPSPVEQRGAIVVRQVLARAIPAEVSEIRATVFDANGRTVHGPTSHGRATWPPIRKN